MKTRKNTTTQKAGATTETVEELFSQIVSANDLDTGTAYWATHTTLFNTETVPASVDSEAFTLIEQELQAGRRHFGAPAATISASDFEDTKEVAGIAERLTSQHVLDWMLNRNINNTVLVDSVSIPGLSDKDTDHVLVMGNTVVVIDTKAFASGYNYKLKSRDSYGHGGVVLKAPRSVMDTNGVCRPSAFKHHGKISTDALCGIWRRYLVEEASVMGIVYINSDNTAVQRNKEWFKAPYRLLDRESLWNFLDRLYSFSKQEVSAIDGSPVGEQLNLALIAQVIVGCTKPAEEPQTSTTPDSEPCVDTQISDAHTANEHYHIEKTSWTMRLCEDTGCPKKSFTYEEARRYIHYSGEYLYGVASDYWLTRNTYASGITDGRKFKGGNAGRGKWRYERLGDIKLHLLTARIGKDRYEQVLENMLAKNPRVGRQQYENGTVFLKKVHKALRNAYRDLQDPLTPDVADKCDGALKGSHIASQWDSVMDIIVDSSADVLEAQGNALAHYQNHRNNR